MSGYPKQFVHSLSKSEYYFGQHVARATIAKMYSIQGQHRWARNWARMAREALQWYYQYKESESQSHH